MSRASSVYSLNRMSPRAAKTPTIPGSLDHAIQREVLEVPPLRGSQHTGPTDARISASSR